MTKFPEAVRTLVDGANGYVAGDREHPGVAVPGGRGVDQVEGRPSGQGGCPGAGTWTGDVSR